MSARDRERWDARHAAATSDVPAPPDALRGRADLLPPAGRALEVACGRGAVAVWLAEQGFTVDAIDISPAGLAAAARLAARHGVETRVRWWAHDLDGGLPADCTGPYQVIVCQRFRDPSHYVELAGRLAPGGLLAITVLSEVGAGPGSFRAVPGELAAAFGRWPVLIEWERAGEAGLVVRRPPDRPE